MAPQQAETLNHLASTAQAQPSIYGLGGWRLADNWAKFALFLLAGYLSMGRAFAYIGLPWINVYIGELALGVFLLFGPRTNLGRWVQVVPRAKRLQRFKWLLVLLLCDGAFEALRGIFSGYPAFTAVRDTAFNYYPLFLSLGIWAGLRDKKFLRHLVRPLAWWNGCYGIVYILLLTRVPWTMPGTADVGSNVPVFSEPLGSAISLLGLLTFETKLRRVWHLLVLNVIVMLWVQMRAEWVGFVVGLLILGWCTKRIKQVAVAGALLAALFGFMFLANINLQSPEGRGGRISVDDIVARAVAPVSKDLASQLAPPGAVVGYVGTASWRLVWWVRIWSQVHASMSSTLLGFGYGYPIGDLNPYIEPGYFIQTPHSDFFYALGYSGWIGVTIFFLLQAELLRLLVHSYKITGRPFGLMCWATLLAMSMFGDFFEAPMGAIPFYLLVGAGLSPILLRVKEKLTQAAVTPPSPT
jgi:O-Antigen ligase